MPRLENDLSSIIPGTMDTLHATAKVGTDPVRTCGAIPTGTRSFGVEISTFTRQETSCPNFKGGRIESSQRGTHADLNCSLDRALTSNNQPAIQAALEVANPDCPLKKLVVTLRTLVEKATAYDAAPYS